MVSFEGKLMGIAWNIEVITEYNVEAAHSGFYKLNCPLQLTANDNRECMYLINS